MKRPSPSTLIAAVALVVAASGTSYAAGKIGTSDIKKNAVTSSKIDNGTIKKKDLAPGVLAGITGPAGSDGADGAGTRWLLVNASGEIEAQSGGFSIAACYPEMPAAATGNCYINANEDLSNNGIVATIALQNQVNQGGGTMNGTNTDGDGMAPSPGDNLEFSGEISATLCGVAGVVACAPTGTNNTSHLVVSPRLSTGERTTADTRKRFYVVITGDSTDFVEPVLAR